MKAPVMRVSSAGSIRTMRSSSVIATLALVDVEPEGAAELFDSEALDVFDVLFLSRYPPPVFLTDYETCVSDALN